jgi:hypothetical protein
VTGLRPEGVVVAGPLRFGDTPASAVVIRAGTYHGNLRTEGVASLIGLGSFLLMRASILPFAGLPIPVAFSKNAGMNSLLLWLDCLALGLLGFALWHGIRALRGRERSPQSKRPLSSA